MKKKIFIVTYGGGHVNIMIPLIKELRKRADLEISTLGLSIAAQALQNAGIEHHTIMKYRDLIMDDNAWRLGYLLAGEMHVEGKGISYEETVIYFGSSMRDLVRDKGEKEAFEIFRETGKACFIPLHTMAKIIEAESPDLLVTGNCPRMERAAMTTASHKGIKVLSFNDLLGFDKKYPFPADKIAVISNVTRENLIRQGNPADKIVITGSPTFDLILDEMKTFDKHCIMQELGLAPSARVFLLATQPQKDCTWEMIDMMMGLLREYPDRYLIIKPHPGDDIRLYSDYLYRKGNSRVILADMQVRKLIFIADLTVTIFSTVGLESILMGVPLIQLNLLGIPNPIPLFEYGVSIEAHNFEELRTAAHKVLNDAETTAIIAENRSKHFGDLISGLGLKNCLKLVYELCGLEMAA